MSVTELLIVIVILVAFLSSLATIAPLRRRGMIEAEAARKSIHIAMGIVTLAFPWLFDSAAPVLLLGALALALLIAIRRVPALRAKLGAALYDITRPSCGDLCFPVAIALVFWLTRGDPAPYGAAVLLLALADSAAALAGQRQNASACASFEKSIRGSLAFFLTAVIAVYVWLSFCTSLDTARILPVALSLSLITTLVERFTARGLDNLFVPLTACLILPAYLDATAIELLVHAGGVATLSVFLFGARHLPLTRRSAFAGVLILFYILWFRGEDALRHLIASL